MTFLAIFRLMRLVILNLTLGVNCVVTNRFSVAQAADKTEYYYFKNVDEYTFFTEKVHREIVIKIALEIFTRYPDNFSQVNSELLITFLNLQDDSKWERRKIDEWFKFSV